MGMVIAVRQQMGALQGAQSRGLGLQAGDPLTGVSWGFEALALQQDLALWTDQLEVEQTIFLAVLLEAGQAVFGHGVSHHRLC